MVAHDRALFGVKVSSEVSADGATEAAEFSIDVARGLVVVKFRARVTVHAIASYTASLRAHPYFDPKFSEITDLREVDDLDLQADEFLILADEVDPFSLEAKRAFLVRTSVQAHAARMHKILRSSRNIQIFENAEEAEGWLGLPLP